ncbi:neural proliferation differentiation and control protein 1 isoform X3 [Agelaius phoeniceus]|uniref:neural proliferation differentiation and control protein 1 isoform X3 n=1 Tax=Agelaius phoeniceus TaxID=39638 RepID=UPI004054CF3B
MVAARGAAARRGALLLLLTALGSFRLRLARAAASCPRSLDCALQRREFCPPGSGACGPCLPPFQEDDHGRCVQRQLSPSGRTSVPSLEAEIDFLADVLARQEAPRHHPLQDGRPRTTLVPNSGRQRVASWLRDGHLQQGPASTVAATTLPTTATVQKYPVEASPIPENDNMVLGLIVVCTVAGISALIVAAICWYRHKEEPKLPDSASSDEENEDGDFTVYECPGLAPTGEMEVRNPLFDDSSLHPSSPKSQQ